MSRTGRPVANQFIMTDGEGNQYFQSYSTVIAVKPRLYPLYDSTCEHPANSKIKLDKDSWDYSVTTGKDRNEFLGEGIAETRRKIASGEYELVNLN